MFVKVWAITVCILAVAAAYGIDYYAYPNTPFGIAMGFVTGAFTGSVAGHIAYRAWTGM